MSTSNNPSETMVSQQSLLARTIRKYTQSWTRAKPPAIDRFLDDAVSTLPLHEETAQRLLIELVEVDIQLRWQQPDPANCPDNAVTILSDSQSTIATKDSFPEDHWLLEQYVELLPQLGSLEELPLELIIAEYKARRRREDHPQVSQLARRFNRSPETLQPILSQEERELVSEGVSINPETQMSTSLITPLDLGGDFGAYELIEEIARGGMGIVFKARQKGLNRLVAIKMILSGQLAATHDIERFHTEAAAAAQLQHPNIVSIHEVGSHGGQYFFSMDYVSGSSLNAIIKRDPPTIRQAALWTKTIAEAIHYAHQQGILHRDLKPSNIMIDEQDNPLITDFGLAKQIQAENQLTSTGQVMGTPSYMSPEQADPTRHVIGTGSDIYSLGSILYELLTGKPPFEASSALKTITLMMETQVVSPRVLNPEVNRNLETICLKCLEKEPGRRYRSALVLAEELNRFLQQEPILARPAGTLEKFWRFCQRKPLVAGLGGLAIILTLFLAISGPLVAWRQQVLRRDADKAQKIARTNEQEAAQQASHAQAARQLARENLQLARRNLYNAHMNLALISWQRANVPHVKSLLEQHVPFHGQPDLRDFEWHYLDRLCHAQLLTMQGGPLVIQLAYSPDGTRLASASGDTTISIWDSQTGDLLHTCKGHRQPVDSIAFSPDGNQLVSGADDWSIRLWDTRTGKLIRTLGKHRRAVLDVAYSPDGKRILSCSEDWTIRTWDPTSGTLQTTLTGHQRPIQQIGFRAHGKQAVSGSLDHTLRIWDLETEKEIRSIPIPAGKIQAFAFDEAGNQAAVALDCDNEHVIFTWDLETGKPIHELAGHTGVIHHVTFSNQGTLLVSGSEDRQIKIWDMASGKQLQPILGHSEPVFTTTFSPDNQRIASGTLSGKIQVWSAGDSAGSLQVGWDDPTPIDQVLFSPDGQYLAAAAADHTIRLWDSFTGKLIQTFRGHTEAVQGIAFLPDGRQLVSGGADNTIRLWDVTSGKNLRTFPGHGLHLRQLRVTPDNQQVISSGNDRSVMRWNLATGERLARFPFPTMTENVFGGLSQDGERVAVVSGLQADILNLWELKTPSQTHRITTPGPISGVVFNPDTSRLATIHQNNEIRIWDVRQRTELVKLQGHSQPILQLVFSPHGQRLATTSEDQSIKIWDTTTGAEIFTLRSHRQAVTSIAFSPDGNRLASADRAGTIHVWDARPRESQDP